MTGWLISLLWGPYWSNMVWQGACGKAKLLTPRWLEIEERQEGTGVPISPS
jgi:hypothetical protein